MIDTILLIVILFVVIAQYRSLKDIKASLARIERGLSKDANR